MSSESVVILSAKRTPIGAFQGVLSAAAAHHEHAHVASEGGSRCRRAALPPARPDARKSTRGGPVGEGRRDPPSRAQPAE